MKTITRINTVIIAVILLTLFNVLCSCTSDQDEQKAIAESITDQDLECLSKVFSIVCLDDNTRKEINQFVIESIRRGLDEQLYFKDIYCAKSKDTRSRNNSYSNLEKRINAALSIASGTRSLSMASKDLSSILKNEDMELYWPYSENWDGIESPVVTFAPIDDRIIDDVIAYAYDEELNSFVELMVNESYAMNHPVWVIRLSETPYNESICVLGNCSNSDLRLTRTGNTGHCWQMDSLQCTYQYDSWLLGGPDFRFIIAYPAGEGYVAATTEFRQNFTRSEVNNEIWKKYPSLSRPLNQDWSVSQITNHLQLVEEDRNNGNSTTLTFSVKALIAGVEVNSSISLPISLYDEHIASEVFSRSYVSSPSRPIIFGFDQNRVLMGHSWVEFTY